MAETKEAARWYVAGMFDGEGTVGVTYGKSKRDGSYVNRKLRVGSTTRELTDAVAECLEVLGIEYRYYTNQTTSRGKPWFLISVHKKAAILKFAEEIPIQHHDKQVALGEIVSEIGNDPQRWGKTDRDRPCECDRDHKDLKICRQISRREAKVPKAADVGEEEEIIEIVPVREPEKKPEPVPA